MYHRLRRPPALLLTLALASPLACGDDEQVTTTDSGTGSDSDDSTTTDGSTSDPTTSTSDPSGSESESTTAGTTEVTTDPTT
ncbi:MAG: hypothetical protein KC636_30980, partial [Myxococcales bacterium]|nr:hypothetical protein [Myxococcales bacterium]